jgi:hypothetical protein
MGSPDRVQVTGPLAAFNSGFAAELVRLGYRPNAAANQLQLMAHLSRWMTQRGLTADGLTASVLADFLAARRAAGYRLWLSPKALSPLVTYLRGLGVAPAEPEPEPGGAVETLFARYRGYLVRERGLSASTAGLYAHLTSPLLASRMVGGELDLASLTAADVIGFVRASCPGRAVGTAKLIVTALRSLLGFLHVEGVIGSPLAPAVPSVAGGRRHRLRQGTATSAASPCRRKRSVASDRPAARSSRRNTATGSTTAPSASTNRCGSPGSPVETSCPCRGTTRLARSLLCGGISVMAGKLSRSQHHAALTHPVRSVSSVNGALACGQLCCTGSPQ